MPELADDERSPTSHHYEFGPGFSEQLRNFLKHCAEERRAAFVLPGYVKPKGTQPQDVLSLPAVLIDFDKGDPAQRLEDVEAIIGPASIVAQSSDAADGAPTLHAYWRLNEPAIVADVCAIREKFARDFGGNIAFKHPTQMIRIPGSVHLGAVPNLVTLLRADTGAGYALTDFPRTPAPVVSDRALVRVENIIPFPDRVVDHAVTRLFRKECLVAVHQHHGLEGRKDCKIIQFPPQPGPTETSALPPSIDTKRGLEL